MTKAFKRLNIIAKLPVSIITKVVNKGLDNTSAISLLKGFSKDFKFKPNFAKKILTEYDSSGFRIIIHCNNGLILYGLYNADGSFKSAAIESENIKEPSPFLYESLLEDRSLVNIKKNIEKLLSGNLDEKNKKYFSALLEKVTEIL